jgi:hypothetical protein
MFAAISIMIQLGGGRGTTDLFSRPKDTELLLKFFRISQGFCAGLPVGFLVKNETLIPADGKAEFVPVIL